MVSIIAFKFIASINFGSPRAPEDHDKFVICQVPCYTEGEVLLRRTIDSLTQLKYDDKRKLILVVCDGNV
ncbi:chitin synthase-domain-containing protein, partial [Boletus edulis]